MLTLQVLVDDGFTGDEAPDDSDGFHEHDAGKSGNWFSEEDGRCELNYSVVALCTARWPQRKHRCPSLSA